MGELAQFGMPDEGDQIAWRDSAGNPLTQEECADLAYRFRVYVPEIDAIREENRLKFVRWLVDTGRLVIGAPDGSAVMRESKVWEPLPHIEWHLYMRSDSEQPQD